MRSSAVKSVGAEQVFEAPSMTASEDFSYYHKVAPVCFVNLGIGSGPANHNPKFNPDESALPNGVKVQVKLKLDFLSAKMIIFKGKKFHINVAFSKTDRRPSLFLHYKSFTLPPIKVVI